MVYVFLCPKNEPSHGFPELLADRFLGFDCVESTLKIAKVLDFQGTSYANIYFLALLRQFCGD